MLCSIKSNSQTNSVTAKQATVHISERVMVCDSVTDTFQSRDGTCFINFGGIYPNQEFTIVIFRSDLKQFYYNPAEYLKDKKVCVEGFIELYKGKPQIVLKNADGIELRD